MRWPTSGTGWVCRLVVILLFTVASSVALVGPVVANSDTTTAAEDGPCAGLSPSSSWICEGLMGVIEWIVEGIQAVVEGLFRGVVEFIVDTPAPYRDGEMAFFEAPDNEPWTNLYQLYLTRTLPMGILLWALIVMLVQFTRLFTRTAGGEAQRTRLNRRAAFGFLMLIAWWPIGSFVLHMAGALTTTIAPTGSEMVGTLNEFFSNIGGGLIAGVLVYLSAGVVAFLLLLVFFTRHVAIYVLMPLMPVLIALWIIDEGPMRYVAGTAEAIGGMFVPFVFMTVPTAAILLVGYSIQDSLRQSLGAIAVLPGASGAATSAYAIILFVFWVMALVAPLFVLFGGQAGVPLGYMTAGFVGSQAIPGVARSGFQRLRNAQIGASGTAATGSAAAAARTAVEEDGTPLPVPAGPSALAPRFDERLNGDHGHAGPREPSGVGGPFAGMLEGETDPVAAVGPTMGRGTAATPKPWDTVRGGIDTEEVRARITPEASFDEQLPDDRRFAFGYSKEGDFQEASQQRRLSKSDIMSKKYPQVAQTRLYQEKPDMYLRDDQGELYDVTPQWHYDTQHARFDEEARDVVFEAQDYDPAEAGGGLV